MFTSFSALSAQVQDHRAQVAADARRFRRQSRRAALRIEPSSEPQRPVLRLLDASG